jgi:hypothetical protein
MMGLRAFGESRSQVISDSADLLTGQTLPAVGWRPARLSGGQTVGTVIVAPTTAA